MIYTVGIYDAEGYGSLWQEEATSPGAALDTALAKRMHNNSDDPPVRFLVTPDSSRESGAGSVSR